MFAFGQIVMLVFLFALGAVVGSFLNVCIYRLPRGKSLAQPAQSYCPLCHEPIAWYDNIPLVSYFALGRQCRRCGGLISPRYFLVELLTAVCFLALFWLLQRRGETSGVITIYLGLLGLLIVSSFIDLELRIIPDELTITGMLLAPVCCLIVPSLHNQPDLHRGLLFVGQPERLGALLAGLVGMAVGAAATYSSGLLGKLLFRKEAMGMGDVKFMAVIGGLLGWKLVLLVFFLAPVLGSAVGLIVLLRSRDHHIPYGPFLSAATLLVMLFSHDILSHLVRGFGVIGG